MTDIERAIREVLNATDATDLGLIGNVEELTQELVDAIEQVVGR